MKKIAVFLLIVLSAVRVFASDSNASQLETVQRQVSNGLNALSIAQNLDLTNNSSGDDAYEQAVSSLESDLGISGLQDKGFFVDGLAHVTLLRDIDFVPGMTLSFGYRNGVSLYSFYTRFDYFLSPLGSKTGRLATLEFNLEPGISFEYVVMMQDWQEVRLAVDFGYYMQFIERAGETSLFYLSNNGLMIRPTISVRVNLVLLKLELGLFYQSAVYPRYEDYDGFGIYLKLF